MTTTDPTVDTAALLAAEDARANDVKRVALAVKAYDALRELERHECGSAPFCSSVAAAIVQVDRIVAQARWFQKDGR